MATKTHNLLNQFPVVGPVASNFFIVINMTAVNIF